MKKDNNSIPDRFFEEKLPDIWSVNEDHKSFDKLQNHLINTTNMFYFFHKAISKVLDFYSPEGLVIADVGGGVGWTSSILSSFPQIKKIYLIDPSPTRLDKSKHVADHYNINKSKVFPIKGDFQKFNLPEKVDIVILNGAFHHCVDEYTKILFENIRKSLKEPKITKYLDYRGKQKQITLRSKILISGEHYLNNIVIYKRFIDYILGKFHLKKQKKDWNGNFYELGKFNPPHYFSGEHDRSKKEIMKLFRKNNFKFEIIEHDEDNLKNKNRLSKFYKNHKTYYYAILEDNN